MLGIKIAGLEIAVFLAQMQFHHRSAVGFGKVLCHLQKLGAKAPTLQIGFHKLHPTEPTTRSRSSSMIQKQSPLLK